MVTGGHMADEKGWVYPAAEETASVKQKATDYRADRWL